MANFWRIVDGVLRDADIVLMVVDARMVEKTRNHELERKVKAMGKPLITVINKADLVEKDMLEPYKQKLAPCVFVSARKFYGMTKLRHKILELSEGRAVTVGVVGYPNTGKSSIINSLRGKAAAGVSATSGFTKGKQNINIDAKIKVIDTPGVLSEGDQAEKFVLTSAVTKLKDPELAAFELFRLHRHQVLEYYGIDGEFTDDEEILEAIAEKLNRYKSGGELDTETTARMVLQEWQKGSI